MFGDSWAGKPILDRSQTCEGFCTGGTRRCRMSGCTGVGVHVRWPDGTWSWPCSKGIGHLTDGRMVIL